MEISELFDFYKHRVEGRIEGWFYNHDILLFWLFDFIQKQAGWRGDLCELGVYQGKSAVALAHMARADERLYGFDIFHEVPARQVRATVGDLCPGLADRLILVQDDLRQRAEPPEMVARGGVRFIHLDAVHDHPSVLNNFAPLLTSQGILVLDDCFDPEWPGVPTAMTEFCLSPAGRHIRPFAASRAKMYLCGRHMVETYQRCVIASGLLTDMSLERVLDGAVLRCFTKWPTPVDQLLTQLKPA
jgi:hypothetical protein